MKVIKVVELMANSDKSWEDAAQNAVDKASESLKSIRSVYVNEMSASVKDGKITDYRVNVKLSFEVQ